ncbi:MAG: DNA-processing protein DprA [Oscillospiraceae bacterium]
MYDKMYWIWLSLIFPYGSDKPNEILSKYETPEHFYNLSEEEMAENDFLTKKDIKIAKGTNIARAKIIIDDCEKKNIKFATFDDDLYPKRLKLIYGSPMVLYYVGDIKNIDDNVVITVVGTRRATDYSAYTTEYFSYNLAKAGAIIVSGCAVGIDASSHIGALRANARTIAVLGCGIDVNYPIPNYELKKSILKKGGALISELPPGENPTPKYFPTRNRIMAGLSLGVLVTHAPERSGSLITVEHAIEQGKDVFCVPPYSIFDSNYFGVIKYLRDGATPVFCAKDILIEYYGKYSHTLNADEIVGDYVTQMQLKNRKANVKVPAEKSQIVILTNDEVEKQTIECHDKDKEYIEKFDENKLLVYNNLNVMPKFIDDLSRESTVNIGNLLAILTEFEIMGIATSFSGRRYALTKK